MIKIVIDASSGDNGSKPVLEGVYQALKKQKFHPILIGDKDDILENIRKKIIKQVDIIDCKDIISMEDSASSVLKRKESSIYKAAELVAQNKAQGLISAGNSGATMSVAAVKIGRLKGVERPAICSYMPTIKGKKSLMLDVGANVDCKPENLFEFAIMGYEYAKAVMNIKEPKVALLSNGEEDSKGDKRNKIAYELLKKLDFFVGNKEGNNILDGSVDVIVCDGFVGNIALKAIEGTGNYAKTVLLAKIKKSLMGICGAILLNKIFKDIRKNIDYEEYGGAPLVGINGNVIICHGKSGSKSIKNAIFNVLEECNHNLNINIENSLAKYKQ